jgi:hypothetical protein
MLKTTVYLPERLKRRLSALARRRGTREAVLVRDAIARLLEEESRPRPRLPLFRSRGGGIAERAEDALAGFGER